MNLFSLIEYRRLIVAGAGSFLVGVLWWSIWPKIFADKNLALFILFLAGSIFIYSFVSTNRRWFLVLSLICLFFSFGLMRISVVNEKIEEASLSDFNNFEVVVISEIDERENSQRFVVLTEDSSVKMMINAPLFPEFSYGDILQIGGQVIVPKNFETDTGRQFDYLSYLKTKGVAYEMYRPQIKIIGSGGGSEFKSFLFALKDNFVGSINKQVPEPNASLANGLLVGARRSLGADIEDLFRRVGIIHIVVLSGYNLTIVAGVIMKLFGFLPRRFNTLFATISIILFVIMVGADSAVVRASVMAILALWATTLGRPSVVSFSLILAGFLMVLVNPFILVYDPGFQLSFLATIGLVYLSPIIASKLFFISDKFGFREIVAVTIGTQIFVAPYLIYLSGNFSLVSLPVNLLVLPIIPATMLFGFLAGLIGLFSTLLALPFTFLVFVGTSYTFLISEFFGAWSLSAVSLPPINILWVVLVYGLLGWYLFVKNRNFATISIIKSNH